MVQPVIPQPVEAVRYDGRDRKSTHFWARISDGELIRFEDQDAKDKIVVHQDGKWVWVTDTNIIHQREMEWRDYMNKNTKWKTPERLNCLRYAASEANEARQAWMDQTFGDPRNNQEKAEDRKREGSVQRELAETVFMIMAALGEDTWFDTDCDAGVYKDSQILDYVCNRIEAAIDSYSNIPDNLYRYSWRKKVKDVVAMIMAYPGVDLGEQQVIWHEKIMAKHG